MCIFSNIRPYNVLFEKMLTFSSVNGRLGTGTFSELVVQGAFCRYAMAEKRIRKHVFLVIF